MKYEKGAGEGMNVRTNESEGMLTVRLNESEESMNVKLNENEGKLSGAESMWGKLKVRTNENER